MRQTLLAAALLSLAVSQAFAGPRTWKDQAELTYLDSTGNTVVRTLGASDLFTVAIGTWSAELKASALDSKSAGVVTAEQYMAAEKLARNLTDRLSLFERFQWDKDRFAGIAGREDASVGVAAIVLKTAADLLNLEVGTGYVWEDRTVGPDNEFASGRLYGKYTHTLSATASLSQDAEYLHDFSDANGYRVNAETAVIASLSTHLSLKASYKWKHVQEPPAGFRKDDGVPALTLVVNH